LSLAQHVDESGGMSGSVTRRVSQICLPNDWAGGCTNDETHCGTDARWSGEFSHGRRCLQRVLL